jgi:hypothetical protein
MSVRGEVLAAASGHILARAIHTAVELRLADRLRGETKSAETLAAELGANPQSLARLMLFLARHGFVVEDSEGRFALTDKGRMLCADAPGNTAAVIASLGSPEVWSAFERLPLAILEGLPPEHRRRGKIYAAGGNRAGEIKFGETMAGYHWGEPEAVAEGWDFSGAALLVDVGGSSGRLLAAILGRHPELHGLIYDRSGIASEAQARIEGAGLGGRCTFSGGDFFEAVPAGGDVYILSHVLHDWDDQAAARILGRCREAMAPGATLLVAEALAATPAADGAPIPADMLLLANTEGRLRTRGEFEALLASAGFHLERVIETTGPVSLIEAIPAPSGLRALLGLGRAPRPR